MKEDGKEEDSSASSISDPAKIPKFVDLMKSEESLEGRLVLTQELQKISNQECLSRFVELGGVMTLASWLADSQAELRSNILKALAVFQYIPFAAMVEASIIATLMGIRDGEFPSVGDEDKPNSALAARLILRWTSKKPRDPASEGRKKRPVRWAETLEEVHVFDRADPDAEVMKQKESGRKLETTVSWTQPKLVEIPTKEFTLLERGQESKEKTEQAQREKSILAVFYIDPNSIPDTPAEAPTESDYDDSSVSVVPLEAPVVEPAPSAQTEGHGVNGGGGEGYPNNNNTQPNNTGKNSQIIADLHKLIEATKVQHSPDMAYSLLRGIATIAQNLSPQEIHANIPTPLLVALSAARVMPPELGQKVAMGGMGMGMGMPGGMPMPVTGAAPSGGMPPIIHILPPHMRGENMGMGPGPAGPGMGGFSGGPPVGGDMYNRGGFGGDRPPFPGGSHDRGEGFGMDMGRGFDGPRHLQPPGPFERGGRGGNAPYRLPPPPRALYGDDREKDYYRDRPDRGYRDRVPDNRDRDRDRDYDDRRDYGRRRGGRGGPGNRGRGGYHSGPGRGGMDGPGRGGMDGPGRGIDGPGRGMDGPGRGMDGPGRGMDRGMEGPGRGGLDGPGRGGMNGPGRDGHMGGMPGGGMSGNMSGFHGNPNAGSNFPPGGPSNSHLQDYPEFGDPNINRIADRDLRDPPRGDESYGPSRFSNRQGR